MCHMNTVYCSCFTTALRSKMKLIKKSNIFCHFHKNIGIHRIGKLIELNPFCDAAVEKSKVM
jgi:hypothetical protein